MFNLCYRNPRLMVLVVCLILVAGLSSFYLLPRMEDPLLNERAANVNTVFPGADAERVEVLITEKLEEELREIEEIKELRSTSRAGISTIAIELRDDVYQVDTVWSRVRDRIDDVTPELPHGALEPEFTQLDIKAYALIVALAWTQDARPNYAILRRLAEQLEDVLQTVSGTEKTELFGDPSEEVVVQIDTAKAAARGLTAEDVSRQIQASDAKLSAGQLRGERGDLMIEVGSELDSVARIGRTPIRHGGDGRFVQLNEIASIEKGIADPPSSVAFVDGQRAVALGARVRSGHRIDHWARTVERTLREVDRRLPRGGGTGHRV